MNKRKIVLIGASLLVISTPLIVTPIMLINPNKQEYYVFDNKVFNNQGEVYEYAYQNSAITNYGATTSDYILDDKVFSGVEALNEYITNKFSITETNTLKNPNDYLLAPSGELSSLVKSDYDELIEVYEGYNGNSYFSRDQALKETYMNWEENYLVDGQLFESLYNAQNYYKDVKLKQLEEDKEKAIIEAYFNGGVWQSKPAIMSWLRKNTKRGFEYKGKAFSELNMKEFISLVESFDDSFYDKYITKRTDLDKSSYWLNYGNDNPNGYFYGPKYIESNQEIRQTKFKKIKQTDISLIGATMPNIFSSVRTMGELMNLSTYLIDEQVNLTSKFEISDYLELVFEKLNLDTKLLDNFSEKYFFSEFKLDAPFDRTAMDDLNKGLDEIDGSKTQNQFTNFHKLLVVFKRMLNYAKVFDIKEISGDNYQEFENDIKLIVVTILNSERKFGNNILQSNNKKGFDILLNDDVSFDDIYSLFLDTSKFYQDGGAKGTMLNAFVNSATLIDEMLNAALNGESNLDEALDNFLGVKDKNEESIEEGLDSFLGAIKMGVNSSTLILNLGLSGASLIPGVDKIVDVIQFGWAIAKAASVLTYITYEAKMDSSQSVFYNMLTWKVPFTNWTGKYKGWVDPIELIKAPLNMLPPKQNNHDVATIYEFNNQYFLDRNAAKKAMQTEIYRNPEKYLTTNKIFANILDIDEVWELKDVPIICENDCQINEPNHECTTADEYETRIAEEKEKFIEKIFEKHYESSKQMYFLDGFGNYFDTWEGAKSSLEEKADKISNYQSVYTYKMNNSLVIKDTQAEIEKFIIDNQTINSKYVLSSDLLQTMRYDLLGSASEFYYQVYELNFYGVKRYFRTKKEAMTFLDNNLVVTEVTLDKNFKNYKYKNYDFLGEEVFTKWIDSQTEITRKQDKERGNYAKL